MWLLLCVFEGGLGGGFLVCDNGLMRSGEMTFIFGVFIERREGLCGCCCCSFLLLLVVGDNLIEVVHTYIHSDRHTTTPPHTQSILQ